MNKRLREAIDKRLKGKVVMSTTKYCRIQIDIDPEKSGEKAALHLYRRWLRFLLDKGIYKARDGSMGPTGFISYVPEENADVCCSWLIQNMSKKWS